MESERNTGIENEVKIELCPLYRNGICRVNEDNCDKNGGPNKSYEYCPTFQYQNTPIDMEEGFLF